MRICKRMMQACAADGLARQECLPGGSERGVQRTSSNSIESGDRTWALSLDNIPSTVAFDIHLPTMNMTSVDVLAPMAALACRSEGTWQHGSQADLSEPPKALMSPHGDHAPWPHSVIWCGCQASGAAPSCRRAAGSRP
jgi:hypothetical protein